MYQKGYQRSDLLRLSEKCRPIGQVQPETGESLVLFQKSNPILFVMYISLFFDILYQSDYQRKDILEIICKMCQSVRQIWPEIEKSHVFFSKH